MEANCALIALRSLPRRTLASISQRANQFADVNTRQDASLRAS